MIAAPVNPAKKMEEMRPRFLGNRLEMCSCARLKHMPPPPRRITPGLRALKLECVLEHPRRIKPVTFSVVPASMKQSAQNRSERGASVRRRRMGTPGDEMHHPDRCWTKQSLTLMNR